MRVWALVSQKGGSGKTTLATHLAVYGESKGEAVALVDLDPQASAAAWAQVRGTDEPVVVPGTPEKIAQAVNVASGMGITLAIIDTAPHTDRNALAAIRAADLIILPVRPSFLDVAALRDTVRLLDLAGKTRQAIAVLNAVPPRGGLEDEAEEALREFGIAVATTRMGQRNPFANAIPQGKGVTEFAPRDAAADEIKRLWKELNELSPGQGRVLEKAKRK